METSARDLEQPLEQPQSTQLEVGKTYYLPQHGRFQLGEKNKSGDISPAYSGRWTRDDEYKYVELPQGWSGKLESITQVEDGALLAYQFSNGQILIGQKGDIQKSFKPERRVTRDGLPAKSARFDAPASFRASDNQDRKRQIVLAADGILPTDDLMRKARAMVSDLKEKDSTQPNYDELEVGKALYYRGDVIQGNDYEAPNISVAPYEIRPGTPGFIHNVSEEISRAKGGNGPDRYTSKMKVGIRFPYTSEVTVDRPASYSSYSAQHNGLVDREFTGPEVAKSFGKNGRNPENTQGNLSPLRAAEIFAGYQSREKDSSDDVVRLVRAAVEIVRNDDHPIPPVPAPEQRHYSRSWYGH